MRTLLRRGTVALGCSAALLASGRPVGAQAVFTAWGNVEGIRLSGQLIPFETSLCLYGPDGREITRTGKERQRPRYTRTGAAARQVTTQLGRLSFVESLNESTAGITNLVVRVTADSATTASAYLCVDAPRAVYGKVERVASAALDVDLRSDTVPAGGVSFASVGGPRRLVLLTSTERSVIRLDSSNARRGYHRVRFPILVGPSDAGRMSQSSFVIRAAGHIDRSPVTVAIDHSREGREFVGMGGNFRIQNPTVDPKVIQYNLENMRMAYGRVEMPWRLWHPVDSLDPATVQPAQLNPRLRAAFEIAKTIHDRGAPVVVSAWFPPQWAVIGELPRGGQRVNGEWGNALDPAKMDAIYRSIGSYLVYLKRHYGVESESFSFNESDLGIDVRQTAEEHNAFIKGFGAHLRTLGLGTKLLLGDVSDATPIDFITPAMRDSAAWPFISAVSYHSWRGWSDSLLTYWSDAAKRLNVPLLVGEGSTDAGAHRYPAVFLEPEFALEEIGLYVRMLALSEPKSILQWQLTSDYSLLAGGGVYGDTTALRPTQRFWNIKQLASTPERVFHLSARCGSPDVLCAALGSRASGSYTVHLVNRGAARSAVITGLPSRVRTLRVWTTDERRGMAEGRRVTVRAGRATVPLAATSFTSVTSAR